VFFFSVQQEFLERKWGGQIFWTKL
jgi:hypothetical protein